MKWNTWNKQCLDQNLRLWETYNDLKEIEYLIENQPEPAEEMELEFLSVWDRILTFFR